MAEPSRKLNILHLVSLMGLGGRAATALRQARLIAARGHHVMVGCIAGSTAAQRSRAEGLEVFDDFQFRRGFRPLAFWRDCRLLARRCDEKSIDIVHAHLSQESWVAAFGTRGSKHRPALIRSRGVVVPVKPHYFNRMLHNRYTQRVIVPSQVIAKGLALPGFAPEKIEYIPDGVDLRRFSPSADGAGIRNEFKVAPDAPFIVMIARLEKVKGHAVFFAALKKLAAEQKVAGLRALCACDERTPGEYEKTICAAREAGLGEELLSFTGLRNDPEKIIAAASVIALPSLGSEGSSRVALEAAACGIPIVASDAGCLPEVVVHQETGLIVPRNNAGALAAGLLEIVSAPQHAREMGAAARKRAVELYDEELMAKRLEDLYLKVSQ